MLSDYDKKNAFDVEAYINYRCRIGMDEDFDMYEVDADEGGNAVTGVGMDTAVDDGQ